MTDEKEIKALTNTLLKVVVIICMCVMGGFILNSCRLDSDTIADCNDACQSASGQMESVTSYTCTCISNAPAPSPWVLN